MRIASDAAYFNPLAAQILRSSYTTAGEQAIGHEIFYASHKYGFGRTAHVCGDITDCARQSHIGITAKKGRRDNAQRDDEDKAVIDVVFLEEPGLLGNPRERLRHHSRRVNRRKLVCGARAYRREKEHDQN